MPAQTVKSSLFARYGGALDTAVRKHAEDKTTYGIINLPGGIVNGIAQLVEAYFSVYKEGPNKGEFFFRAAGTVITPETVMTPDGPQEVAGLQTSIMVPVCKTTTKTGKETSQDANIERILNEMRRLGGEKFTEGCGGADLEGLAEQLVELAPYFRFSTELSKPVPGSTYAPRVWENWHGTRGLENYVPEVNATALVDNSEDGSSSQVTVQSNITRTAPSGRAPAAPTASPGKKTTQTSSNANGEAVEPSNASGKGTEAAPVVKRGPGRPKKVTPTPEPVVEPDEGSDDRQSGSGDEETVVNFDEFGDLDSLVKRASKKDADAQNLLGELAMKAGIDEETIDHATSWQSVADMITAARQTGGNDGTDGQEETGDDSGTDEGVDDQTEEIHTPIVEEVCSYCPPDKKTGKPGKQLECEVVKVFPKNSTATLKNLTTGKEYIDVPWGMLLWDEEG